MARPAKRQHFIARFYLRNFAEPMFSDKLCVYDVRKRCWEERTPKGVGWFPHLCSMIDMEGNRTDDFDQFLKQSVEDPAAPALKKLATAGTFDAKERSAVALFVALTAARSPGMASSMEAYHLDKLDAGELAELDARLECWCQSIGKPYTQKSRSEFLKPSRFGAIWMWSRSIQQRLLQWDWHIVCTTRDRPFITSDRPVGLERDSDEALHLVTFPVSSEVALIVVGGGQFNEARDRDHDVFAMNRQTMDRATEFIVACQMNFPAHDHLKTLGRGA